MVFRDFRDLNQTIRHWNKKKKLRNKRNKRKLRKEADLFRRFRLFRLFRSFSDDNAEMRRLIRRLATPFASAIAECGSGSGG
jgi:hypothetical protein